MEIEHDRHVTKQAVSWKDIEDSVAKIVSVVKERGYDIKQVFGLPRGGLVAAVMLSHALRIPMVFDDRVIDDKTLAVDDAIDEGRTIMELLEKNPKVAILYQSDERFLNKTLAAYPDLITVNVKAPDVWIVFPWEKQE